MTTPTPRKSSLGLPALILDYIELQPRTVIELAKLTGFSDTTIRSRLELLESRLSIHRVAHKNANNVGTWFTWHAGLEPECAEDAEPEQVDPIELPKRFFATSFPPIGRRDPLVAALFGAPEARP